MRIRGSLTGNGSTFLSGCADAAIAPIRKPAWNSPTGKSALRGVEFADWKVGVTKKRARLKQKRVFFRKRWSVFAKVREVNYALEGQIKV